MIRKRILPLFVVILVVGVMASVLAWQYSTPAPFIIQVTTRPTVTSGSETNVQTIAKQKCVLLVGVAEQEGWLHGRVGVGEAVNITATDSSNKANITVHPQQITSGQVAEVTVIPSLASVNETFTVTITGEREAVTQTQTVTIEVLPGDDSLRQQAAKMQGLFLPWLVDHHPEFGFTHETEWTGTIVNPKILVVMHYIFYSEDWEMYVTWHVTIPPHDWTRIYLRRRFSEVVPSYAFEISSVTSPVDPHPIEVPDWI